jgi:hypothetical protein
MSNHSALALTGSLMDSKLYGGQWQSGTNNIQDASLQASKLSSALTSTALPCRWLQCQFSRPNNIRANFDIHRRDKFTIHSKAVVCQDVELKGDITIGSGHHPTATVSGYPS